MKSQGLIKVVDLEQDIRAVEIECSKIVLTVGVIRVAEVIEHRDGFDETLDSFNSEGGDARTLVRLAPNLFFGAI